MTTTYLKQRAQSKTTVFIFSLANCTFTFICTLYILIHCIEWEVLPNRWWFKECEQCVNTSEWLWKKRIIEQCLIKPVEVMSTVLVFSAGAIYLSVCSDSANMIDSIKSPSSLIYYSFHFTLPGECRTRAQLRNSLLFRAPRRQANNRKNVSQPASSVSFPNTRSALFLSVCCINLV